MKLKQLMARMTPSFIKDKAQLQAESELLNSIGRLDCRIDNLRPKNGFSLCEIVESPEIDQAWIESEKELAQFDLPDGTGGVNPGDRRAIYYLISALSPSSVLEIGTHIGASTVHIASAVNRHRISSGKEPKVTTVDIADVNSVVNKPWLKFGTVHSPKEMIEKLGYQSLVDFVTGTSLDYASNCGQSFDFIFLDGDHSAETVYQEVPVALDLLSPGGVILLHDYFPYRKPLWSDGSVLPGPFVATERLREEGVELTVLPLGELPWPTKLQSNVTSLALLLKDA